ncbi:unnamed protein product [Brugia pahangi]|uniref:Col_cuticle_N domain-containing protein n=1 Tax=Brugia pahangi TaxID=6280 RepID=A0A0N4TL27_BRUPA|nr:unnamed protein product [Brugia pahangi]
MVNDIERIRERLLCTEKLKYLAFFGVATSAFIAIDRSLELFKRLSERNLKQKREDNFDQLIKKRQVETIAVQHDHRVQLDQRVAMGKMVWMGYQEAMEYRELMKLISALNVTKRDVGSPGPVGPKGPPGVPGLNADGGFARTSRTKGQPGIDGHIVKQPGPPDFQVYLSKRILITMKDETLQYDMMLSGPQGPVGTPGVQGLPGIPGPSDCLLAQITGEQDPPRDPDIPGLDGCPGFPGKKGTTGKRGPSESCVHCPNARTAPGY